MYLFIHFLPFQRMKCAFLCARVRDKLGSGPRLLSTSQWTVDLTTKLADCTKGWMWLLICHYGVLHFSWNALLLAHRRDVHTHTNTHMHGISVLGVHREHY